ncbi:MAG: L,D-transpeptidase family protein, partial [Bacteroidota bacterium]
DEYDLLRKRLETYISISKEGGWPTLPDTISLRPGDYDNSVYDIRNRLSYSNDLGVSLSGGRGSGVYEGKLVDAVKSFQKRHGLNSNGIVDKETIEAMNVSVDYRIAQIKINLERLRWMPHEKDEKYLLVNVPEFKLRIYRKNKVVDDMRVIVGRLGTPTPLINSEIDYVIMSPTWAVPNQIFNESVLPKVKKDPNYLDNAGYKLYASLDGNSETLIDPSSLKWNEIEVIQNDYRVIHTPSPSDEKKGGIKFVIPNSESLYLCDAPTPSLFDFSYRTFNYTSISVEEPKKLARYIINQKKWDLEAIEENMNLKEPFTIVPESKIPIYVTYLTSIIDDRGNLIFSKDIYEYDKKQAELMGIDMTASVFNDSFSE